MNIKERFPDEQALKGKIVVKLPQFVSQIKTSVGHLEKSYRKARRNNIFGLSLIIIGIIIIFITNLFAETFLLIILFVAGLTTVIPGLFMMLKAQSAIKEFNTKLNAQLFPLVVSIFGLKGSHSNDNVRSKELRSQVNLNRQFTFKSIRNIKKPILKELDESQLITESRNTVYVEDSMRIDINNKALFVQELDVKHVTRRGKHSYTKNIFKGYFVSFELSKQLEHKTFVSTEGDKDGFGHQSFWSGAQTNKLETTELEWNDFEEKLHVTTTNPVEARYVLTPSFMQDLYLWWKGKNENIRISFIGNKMHLLFPNKQIRIGHTISEISEDKIKEYVESIAVPLLHVLHLVEDVENGF